MSRATCPRAWEAEAIEDGRLDEHAAASFERHIVQCNECACEANELRELHGAFGRLEPRGLSPLEQRRQRTELLRRANERIVTRQESPRWSREIAAVAALIVLAALVVGLERRHASRATSALAKPASTARNSEPVFELRAIDGANFHDETNGPHGRVVLSTGSLAVHVEHLRPLQTFVVDVPDGELEVRGTRFIIEVRGGHTERVLVTEGVVAVRLAGSPQRTLAAGESWTRPSPPPLGADREVLIDAVNDAGTGRDRERASGPGVNVHRPQRSPGARAERRSGSPAVPERAAAPREFAAAMASFDAGAYLDADERFSAFATRFPSDTRDEDAAFLRAVIAVKRGDSTAAVSRARDYLRRFPRGLRRAEMERLVITPW